MFFQAAPLLIEELGTGFGVLLSPMNILIFVFALMLGLLVGAIPGLGGMIAVVLMIPLTYSLNSTSAIMMLGVIYVASVYGGSLSAIMFKVPGQSNSVMTVLDGYEMNQKGRLEEAISVAVFASAVGGVIGVIILIFFTPVLSNFAMQLSDPEIFAVIFLGLALISTIGADNILKAGMMMGIGIFIGTIGFDPNVFEPRFTFGIRILNTGIGFVPVILGTFAVAEVLKQVRTGGEMVTDSSEEGGVDLSKSIFPRLSYFTRFARYLSFNSVLGTVIGILPGAGATAGAVFGYTFGQRISPKEIREKFGSGIPEGVAAPEVANNAAAVGSFVPMLTLGIPGSGTTAVILAAFILHGIQPGPQLLSSQPVLVYTLFAALLVANIGIFVMNRPFVKLFGAVRYVPRALLLSLLLMFTVIGAFAINNIIFDVWLMIGAGVLGYYLVRYNYPPAPLVIGLILGPLAEPSLRRAVIKAGGDYLVFFNRPVSAVLILAGVIMFIIPLLLENKAVMQRIFTVTGRQLGREE